MLLNCVVDATRLGVAGGGSAVAEGCSLVVFRGGGKVEDEANADDGLDGGRICCVGLSDDVEVGVRVLLGEAVDTFGREMLGEVEGDMHLN